MERRGIHGSTLNEKALKRLERLEEGCSSKREGESGGGEKGVQNVSSLAPSAPKLADRIIG